MAFIQLIRGAPSVAPKLFKYYQASSNFMNAVPRSFSTSERDATQKFINTRYTHFIEDNQRNATVPSVVAPVVSIETSNSKQALAVKKKEMINQFQMHHADTGSSQVQIAILTERIISLTKHFAVHKKDKSGYRGYIATIQKRKRLMLHLKRHDPEAYKNVVIEKNLFKEAEQLIKSNK